MFAWAMADPSWGELIIDNFNLPLVNIGLKRLHRTTLHQVSVIIGRRTTNVDKLPAETLERTPMACK